MEACLRTKGVSTRKRLKELSFTCNQTMHIQHNSVSIAGHAKQNMMMQSIWLPVVICITCGIGWQSSQAINEQYEGI